MDLTTVRCAKYFAPGMERLRSGRTGYPLSIAYTMEQLPEYLSRFNDTKTIELLASQLNLIMDSGIKNLPHRSEGHVIVSYVTVAETGLAHVELQRVAKGNKTSKSEIYCALSLALCEWALSNLEKYGNEDSRRVLDGLASQAQHALGMAMGQHQWNPKPNAARESESSSLSRRIHELIASHEGPIGKQMILEFLETNEQLIRKSIRLKKKGNQPIAEYLPSVKKRIYRARRNSAP